MFLPFQIIHVSIPSAFSFVDTLESLKMYRSNNKLCTVVELPNRGTRGYREIISCHGRRFAK